MLIQRPLYMQQIKSWKDKTDIIKIVTGIRRCGKSTLLKMFMDSLKKSGIPENRIIHINMEMAENYRLLDWQALYAHIESLLPPEGTAYIFLDEIQMVQDFQRAVNSLRLKGNADMYLTGSNAYMFSQKISTLLSGRYVEIKMLPLSFKEYMSAFPGADSNSWDKKFADYAAYGSLPQVLQFYGKGNHGKETFDIALWHNYLDSVYNTILVKDIISRHGIKEINKLHSVIKFLFGNIGSETSISKISNTINSLGTLSGTGKMHHSTIEKFIQSLMEGYVFYEARPMLAKGRRMLSGNAKYYAADTGMRYYLLGGMDKMEDSGHILENIVYAELLRRGYEAGPCKTGGYEIDFAARKPGSGIEYYQVAQSVLNEETLARELRPLQAIKDNYPKFLLTRDYSNADYNGIKQVNVLEWLMQ